MHGTDQPVDREIDEHIREDQQDAYPLGRKFSRKKRRESSKLRASTILRNAKFVIEDHYDDCGNDLSGLGPHVMEEDNLAPKISPFLNDQLCQVRVRQSESLEHALIQASADSSP